MTVALAEPTLTQSAPPKLSLPQTNAEVNQRKPKAIHAIDVDVHHQFDKPEVLFPYLPRNYWD